MNLLIKKMAISISIASFSVLLAGCAQDGSMSKQNIGVIGGAVAGGLLGSTVGQGSGRLLATGLGAILGGMAGQAIGKSMDEQDKQNMQGALDSVPEGQAVGWKNQQGAQYTFKPVRGGTYYSEKEYHHVAKIKRHYKECREFYQEVYIGGKKQQAYGTACRNGSHEAWKIINTEKMKG